MPLHGFEEDPPAWTHELAKVTKKVLRKKRHLHDLFCSSSPLALRKFSEKSTYETHELLNTMCPLMYTSRSPHYVGNLWHTWFVRHRKNTFQHLGDPGDAEPDARPFCMQWPAE